MDDYTAPELPTEQVAEIRLNMDQAARALKSLSPERAEALVLRLFAGLSATEAAEVMGKSEVAVKMLVYRSILHDKPIH